MNKNVLLLIFGGILLCVAIGVFVYTSKVEFENPAEEVTEDVVAEKNTIPKEESRGYTQVSNRTPEEYRQLIEDGVREKTNAVDLNATYVDISVEDKAGNKTNLSDYKGQAVMILFWNSENEDSIEMLKRVNAISDKYKEKVKILAIDTLDENPEALLQGITIPIYYDKDKSAQNNYNISELPSMVYINKDNEVYNSKIGLTSLDALEANFDIMAENF